MGGRTRSAEGAHWAVATPHWAATDAAAEVFEEEGGNALDAALAAAITLAVTYPQACGVGGDLFALVHHPDGQAVAINASGAAPVGIDPGAVRDSHASMPQHGPLTITAPGAVSGWGLLHAEGATIPWERAFRDPIGHARGGVPVARSLAVTLGEHEERLVGDPGIRSIFFPQGVALEPGATLAQPALAETLEAISADGPGVLYGGDVGRRYVVGLRRAGSPISLEDLARHEGELVPPLAGRYRDLDVLVAPPNSQGFVLLEILAAIERARIDPDPLGPDAGRIARIIRSATGDRGRHLADPRVRRVPMTTLLDDGHIAALLDEALRNVAPLPDLALEAGDTVALVTADAQGRRVSLIQSLYDGLGSGILEPSTGIVAHSRGSSFRLEPEHPNALTPGARPAHTLMPVLARRADRVVAVSGSMGGSAQPQINAMSILRSFDLGMNPSDTLGAPRWLVDGIDAEESRPAVVVEGRVLSDVRTSLAAAGFEVRELAPLDEGTGHAHLIRIGDDGSFEAAADPRSDGSAAAG